MDDSGEQREDLKLPDGELGDEIKTKFENDDQLLLTVLSSMNEEAVIATKPYQNK